ncbi:hypothetical protein AGLY_015835 [Aphis glycines]|uniref:Uncharacterized protein n=1 Tax=Aphis glycines TaxID=307491 RepID=A0A6G0T0A0_APHGL|nr:hypothetical protein AGLY_015835 [Aphis glycines]
MSLARRSNKNKGGGLINTLINKLLVELHVPGYQYCGPGTKLKKRLVRGDKGINPLDAARRDHDIAYERSNSFADRNEADRILEQRAWERFKSKDSGLKEKAVAWGVTTAMQVKRKVGGGCGCGFKAVVKATKNVLKKNVGEKNLMKLTKKCVAVARKTFKSTKTKVPRIVNILKKGGVLPLIPIFAGLSALGALTGGVSNVFNVANEFKSNVPSHLGNGLYLTPYKGNSYKIGDGLYITPYKNGGGRVKTKKTNIYVTQESVVRFRTYKNRAFVENTTFHRQVENTAQICLLSLLTNNSIPNIEPGCNTIGFRNMIGQVENVIISTGTYELEDLEFVINKLKPDYITFFELKSDSNTLKCMISCSHEIDFSIENSIATLLGFRNVVYTTDVTAGYVDDCKITQMQYHSFTPYSNTSFSYNDEIRINIQNMESYTLPCERYIYIEGKLRKPLDAVGDVRFSNNGLAFLFSEMRYEINGIEIQKLKSPGVSSCLKAYCSYTSSDLNTLDNCAWDSGIDGEDNKNFMSNDVFTGCMPLKRLFEFCEDYKNILLNCNQQLILNRSSTDLDALRMTQTGTPENVEKIKK